MPGLLEEQPKGEDGDKKAFPHAGASTNTGGTGAPLPKGVVLDKDGKPYAGQLLVARSRSQADTSTDVEPAPRPPRGWP